ncbi:MAG TPA: DUF4352 domain-containing protein [Mycobacteriales bacterium]|nr:DUF4352 domain-containing protein [Mycobacteriales bacterium]
MHHPPDPVPRRARRGRGLVAVLASAIAVLVAVGLGLTVALISHAQAVEAATPAAPGVAKDTSFGHVRISDIERVSPMDMNAMPTVNGQAVNMGMGGDVPQGSIALICTVTLSNTKSHQVSVSPTSFTLQRATTKGVQTIKPEKTTMAAAAQLPPNGSLDTQVTFIVPEDGAPLRMAFADAGSNTPVLFDAGTTDSTPSMAGMDMSNH